MRVGSLAAATVAILLYRFLSLWCLETFSRSISLAVYRWSLYIFLADQISYRSYVSSVYRMRSLAVSGPNVKPACLQKFFTIEYYTSGCSHADHSHTIFLAELLY